VAYFGAVTEAFGLAGSAALLGGDGESIHGATLAELADVVESAALLVNISGHLTFEPLRRRFRRKGYVDLDPGVTPFWHAAGTADLRLDGHDAFFTVGENVGAPGCTIPTGGVPWRPIRQPVVLEHWPVSAAAERDRFTTVASWRGPYGPVEYGGRTFGLKVHEFRKLV